MSAVLNEKPVVPIVAPLHQSSPGLWTLAWRRLKRDKVGMVSLAVVLFFILMILSLIVFKFFGSRVYYENPGE